MHAGQPAGEAKRQGATASDGILDSTEARDLFQAALGVLVLGHKGQVKGVSVLESAPSQALVDLMPAVFHMPYLKVRIESVRSLATLLFSHPDGQAMSDRAKLLPTIAASLARMRNAESPSLRQKIESFAAPETRGAAGEGLPLEQVVSGIEGRA